MLSLIIQLRATIQNRTECEACLFELAREHAEIEMLRPLYKELLKLLTEEMRLKLIRLQRTATIQIQISLREQIVLSYREKMKRISHQLNTYYLH